MIGRDSREIATYADERPRARANRELLQSGRTRIEVTACRQDGSEVEVEIVAVAARDDRGEVLGYLGIHRDVSEREQAEREQRRLVSIVERSADFIGIADMDWRVTFVNDAGRLWWASWGRTSRRPGSSTTSLPRTATSSVTRCSRWSSSEDAGGPSTSCDRHFPRTRSSPCSATPRSGASASRPPCASTRAGAPPPVVIGSREAPFGVHGALSTSARRFSEDDVNFLQAVANVLATAAERSPSERLRDAREAERRRIARDLHDEALRDLNSRSRRRSAPSSRAAVQARASRSSSRRSSASGSSRAARSTTCD